MKLAAQISRFRGNRAVEAVKLDDGQRIEWRDGRKGRLIGALLVGRPHALPAIRRELQQANNQTQQDRSAA